MKSRIKGLRRIIIIILFVILALLLLIKGLIYIKQKKVLHKDVEVLFENVYIMDQSDGKLTILHHGSVDIFEGEAEKSCIGVADLRVKNGKIIEIITKQDYVTGNLKKYKDGSMYLELKQEDMEENQLEIFPYDDQFQVYSLLNEKVEQITTNDLVMGASEIKAVLSKGKICALIQEKPSEFDLIRVLMKNGDDIYYHEPISICEGDNGFYIANDKGERLTRDCIGELKILEEKEGYVVINTLPVEDYVRYVTPSEMPASWDLEALKAQAVCARTYAYSQMKNNHYAAFGANLDNTVSYQVYNNMALTDATNRAAEETKYQVLTNQEQLITCYFFSTSAGLTNTMEVWDSKNPDFIHSVESIDDTSNLFEWSCELDYSLEDSNLLGPIEKIDIIRRNSGNYITEAIIYYRDGIRSYKNEYKLRRILSERMINLKDKKGNSLEGWGLLPSASFELEEIDGVMKVTGAGYGHGIGMSQQGAGKMAKEGKTYEEILKYYYSNVELTDIRNLEMK